MKTKIRQYLSWQRLLALVALGLLVGFTVVHTSSAQTFTQGYGSDKPLQRGMLVKLKKDDTKKVEAVAVDAADQTYGVVVSATDASVTISASSAENYVATTGHYDVLVTNQNGAISPGDYITVSAIEGMGTKATGADHTVVGRAMAGFDGKANVASTAEITDSQKNKHAVTIGRISVDIGVAKNPQFKTTEASVPDFLRKASVAVTGKEASPARVYSGIVVFCITTAIAASLMYSGIRSGVISIGRNPLSKKSIVRTMFQVIVTGLIVFVAGVFGVYLLLKI